jgi:hypothetical protein
MGSSYDDGAFDFERNSPAGGSQKSNGRSGFVSVAPVASAARHNLQPLGYLMASVE